MASELPPEFVLVRGVAYRRLRKPRGWAEYYYRRISVPPDATPGKKSKWPASYSVDKLPAHEVVTKEEATMLSRSTAAALMEKLKQLAGNVQEGRANG